MIQAKTLQAEWVNSLRKSTFKGSDPALIEKMIFAFYLLENLVKQDIDFVFKGGTSLILITGESARFSTDIDISTEIDREALEGELSKLVESSEFTKFELDERRSYKIDGIPKAHYFFEYKSSFNKSANSVLLDILFHPNEYPEVTELEIKTPVLFTEEPYLKVVMPTVNTILGDKLTAFAPNTTGVPYNRRKELEIVKQLFDVSRLINISTDYELVFQSYQSIVKSEIRFRNLKIDYKGVLLDTIQTCLLIARRERNKKEELKKFNEIQKGLRSFTNHTIGSKFRIDQAIESAAKIAWFASRLLIENFEKIKLYDSEIDLSEFKFKTVDLSFLSKFKKTNIAAFYYWYKCIEELNEKKLLI
jgi:hypothetical protein